MTNATTAGPAFPALPVGITGLAAIAGGGLLAANQPALGVFVCLLGMGLTVLLWMRELSAREQQLMTKISQVSAAATAAAQAAAPAIDLARLKNDWVSGMEGQLSAARNQVESAANDLSHALGQARDRLQELGRLQGESGDSMNASGAGVAAQVQNSLSDMLGSINRSLEEKTAMFDEVRGFVNATDELARMASSVEELAAKTNLLALNAAIEAARAGEEGRGFSIVADEVRKLSMLSAETGQQIRQRVADISAAARRAGEGADRMQGSDAKLLNHAQATVSEVVDSFARAAEPLQATARSLSEQVERIAGDIDQAESGLGFQNDVATALAAVDNSLQAFRGQLAAGGDIDVGALVRPLNERSFAPAHRPAAPVSRASAAPSRPAPSAAPAAGASGGSGGGLDITFF